MNILRQALLTLTFSISYSASAAPLSTLIDLDCSNAHQKACMQSTYIGQRYGACAARVSVNIKSDVTQILSSSAGWTNRSDDEKNALIALKTSETAMAYENCAEAVNNANGIFSPHAPGNVWSNQFVVGYMHSSDYDDDGQHNGLDNTGALAEFVFNGRWYLGDAGNLSERAMMQWEIGGIFAQSGEPLTSNSSEAGANIQDGDGADSNSPGMPDMPSMDMPAEDSGNSEPTFGDVTDTLDFYTKVMYTPSYFQFDNHSRVAFGPLIGFQTRDIRQDDGDSVIAYGGLSLDFNYFGPDVSRMRNAIPRGRISLAYAYFESYGGADDQDRWILSADWRLQKDSDAIVGIRANLGHGQDDIGIFLGVRKKTSDLAKFFGLSN